MKIRNWFSQALPHIIAILIFAAISLVYFYPVLEGKVIHTNDGTVAANSAKEIGDFRAKYGKEPLWTNSMFSGMPAYLISVYYKGNVIQYFNTFLHFLKHPASSIFLTMLGFYILLLLFRADQKLAIAGAIGYGLSTYFFFILAAGHNTKAIAISYMAPMIGSIYYTYRYDSLKGALLTTFFLSLEIFANHPQITYYALLCILVMVITEFIFALKAGEIKKYITTSLLLVAPVVLAVGMNFNSLYSVYEYGKYSTRGKSDLVTKNEGQPAGLDKEYITQWSYGIDETLTLFIPNFRGGACQPFDNNSATVKALRQNNAGQYIRQFQQYWGSQPWVDGPVYVGAIVFFLFIMGLILVKGPEKWWLLAATLLSIMLAWGKNFWPLTNIFIDYFPGYNKFRAVTMTLVIAEFCIPLLGILAVRDILNGTADRKAVWRATGIAFGITGGLALIFALMPGLAGSFVSEQEKSAGYPAWLSAAITSDRKDLLRGDAFRSFFFILLGAGVIAGFYYGKLKKHHVAVLLGVLFLFDMWLVDKRYLNSDKFVRKEARAKMQAPTVADKFILQDTTYHRVLNLSVSPFNDATTSVYHKSIGGYHGAKLERYKELIDSSLMRDIMLIQTVGGAAKTLDEVHSVFDRTSALNMLNTRYIIYSPDEMPLINSRALGNAWFTETAMMVDNANEELAQINKQDPATVAVIDRKFGDQVKSTSYPVEPGDTIYLKSYKANELIYGTKAGSEKLAVFSEIYYPAGWKCFTDGKETKYFRTDYVLRGMIVPAGEHEIRFYFGPSSYQTGNMVSLFSSVIFILLAGGYVFMQLRSKSGRE